MAAACATGVQWIAPFQSVQLGIARRRRSSGELVGESIRAPCTGADVANAKLAGVERADHEHHVDHKPMAVDSFTVPSADAPA